MKILIVDDQQTNVLIFKSLVEKFGGHSAVCFTEPRQALLWCQDETPDLLILDYMMPDLDGLEFIRLFRNLESCAEIPLLMVTADHEKKVRYEALQLGANDFLTKPIDKTEFLVRVSNMLHLRKHHLALHDRAVLLELEVEKATEQIRKGERETIFRLSNAAEYRDPETGAHIKRMGRLSELIARNLGFTKSEQKLLLRAAPMHDIGKVGIPDNILLKPGPLTREEFDIIKTHPQIGFDILSNSQSSLLEAGAQISLSHHEKFDGSGYPQGLSGEEIPLMGRICAVADVYDALTSARPYKLAWPPEKALTLLSEERGGHFDPDCIDAFFADLEQVGLICAAFSDAGPDDGLSLKRKPEQESNV